MVAQGDVLFRRVDAIPDGFSAAQPEGGRHILAHSETGHHHVVDASDAIRFEGSNPLVAYLRLESDTADVTHLRSFDTHGMVCLEGGKGAIWEVRRQREWDGAAERSAAD